jgi:hypothetical protein
VRFVRELIALGTLGQDQRAQGADVIRWRQSIGRRRHGARKRRF